MIGTVKERSKAFDSPQGNGAKQSGTELKNLFTESSGICSNGLYLIFFCILYLNIPLGYDNDR